MDAGHTGGQNVARSRPVFSIARLGCSDAGCGGGGKQDRGGSGANGGRSGANGGESGAKRGADLGQLGAQETASSSASHFYLKAVPSSVCASPPEPWVSERWKAAGEKHCGNGCPCCSTCYSARAKAVLACGRPSERQPRCRALRRRSKLKGRACCKSPCYGRTRSA